jgi:autotransporter-associated beta strand protein
VGQKAVFAAGTDATDPYTVTVDGTQDTNGLTFEEGTVTLINGTSGALRLTGNTPAIVAAGRTATIATPIIEDATGRELVKLGTGTLVLAGDLAHTGATTVAQGTVVVSGNNAAATGTLNLNGGVTRFESPTSINGTGENITLNAGGTVMFGSSFGAGNIASALDRMVITSAGVIAADNQDAANFDFNAAGLASAYLGAVGSVSYTGTLTPSGTTYRLGGGGGTLTMATANGVTGTGNSLVVNGNVTLAAANNFDTGTTLSAGTLAVGDDGALGSGALTLNSGTIQTADTTARVLANALVLGGNVTIGGTGDLTFSDSAATPLGATRTFTINNPATTFAQAFSGAFGITKAGAGAMTLSGANTYTGTTTVSAGTLALTGTNDSAGAMALTAGTLKLGGTTNAGLASGTVTFGNGTLGAAVIQAVTADQAISNNVVQNQNNGTISGAQSLQVNGIFTNSGGNRTLTNNIDPGKALTLAGQVKLSEHASTGRILTLAGTGATTISGQIVNGATGGGGLTKTGAGTLTLTNTNPYTGATSVTGGTLAVSGTGDINTSTGITINGVGAAFMHNSSVANTRAFTLTRGTLGGAGTLTTAITAGANVIIAPGDRTLAVPAKGTLTVNNEVTLNAGSTVALRLFGPSTGDNDKLVQDTTGTITFGGTLSVSISGSLPPVAGTTYDLFDWLGTATGTFSSINLPTLDPGFKWHDYGGGVFFDYTTGQLMVDADSVPPMLVSIVDDTSPASAVANTLVTYTVTFSEDMDASTVTAADFSNAGIATVAIGTVTEISPGVFSVPVTPTSGGTLQLQVPVEAELKDAASNPLDNDPAIVDETILTVISAYDAWAGGAAFDADANNDGIANGLAWLLGAADPSANATGLTPVATHQAGKLIMTFRALKTANRGGVVLKVQYSNDLGLTDPWAGNQAVVPDVDGTVGSVFFDISPNADPNLINVRAEIQASEASANGQLFGRLMAEP